jgi:hypothetical protein
VGNYSPDFARCFEAAINPDGRQPIPVRLFNWSSENHHIGRADGAIRLIDELASLKLGPSRRVLLWGHSHAGNVFALIANLLGNRPGAVAEFFEAAEVYYRWPLVGLVDIPVWSRVCKLLEGPAPPVADVSLDMVTFGTPILYGWGAGGYSRLLHFIHHRPRPGLPEYLAPFPPKLEDVMSAADGDYVQQLGIAGTSEMPSIFAWRARLAENRLGELWQPQPSHGQGAERFQAGAIVPEAGTTLLVDYGLPQGGIAQHLAGHAVYTRKRWLLFHAEEVARRLYGARIDAA